MGLLSLILGNWQRLAAIGILLALVSAWAMFQHQGSELARAREALAQTRQMLATATAQAHLNQTATDEADHSQRTDHSSRAAVDQARQDIANAADSRSLYAAWHDGIVRVRNDAGAAVA